MLPTEKEYILWLTFLYGFGPVKGRNLLRKYGTAKVIFENQHEIFEGMEEAAIRSSAAYDKATNVIEMCQKQNVSIIGYGDIEYSNEWKDFNDFPLVLYKKGNLSLNGINGIGIVGARRCSEFGKRSAIELAENAVNEKRIVISGMAKGVDSYAHTSAIKSGGQTIAVLGNGVDICYPKEHRNLYEAICDNGAIVSEYAPGTIPQRYHFPRRNRIIAALSEEIYVIDAGGRSGTKSTVEAAVRYGRGVNVKSPRMQSYVPQILKNS